MRACVSFVVYCKPFTKEEPSTDEQRIAIMNSMRVCVCVCFIQSTESPILEAPFWSENGVSCPRERNKIGDSALCSHCVCVRFFCSRLQTFYKRRAFNRWATHRYNEPNACVCVCVSFVVDCKPFTKEEPSTDEQRIAIMNPMRVCVCVFLL
jgi:hypothetical protein